METCCMWRMQATQEACCVDKVSSQQVLVQTNLNVICILKRVWGQAQSACNSCLDRMCRVVSCSAPSTSTGSDAAGQAVALSEDHKPLADTERQRIEAAGGTVNDVGGVARVNSNLNLSRAIGDLKYKGNKDLTPDKQVITAQPDVRIFELTKEDRFFVLACDGIWDVMSNQVRAPCSLACFELHAAACHPAAAVHASALAR